LSHTDSISQTLTIPADSPAGKWLIEHGVEPRDFNSYGARRGNHEVMMRGTFANIRLRNELTPQEGGWTAHQPDGEEMTIQAGQYLLKPRGLKHAFWNPTDKPARIIEVIAPAGLERFFRTMGTLRPVPGTEDFDTAMALVAERGVETHFDEREAFLARHGLQAPAMSIAHG